MRYIIVKMLLTFSQVVSANKRSFLVMVLVILSHVASAEEKLLQLEYEGFTLWFNCQRHGAEFFRYTAKADVGNVPRREQFTLDPNVPAACQQKNAKTYKHPGVAFDRGHLVPANHMDFSVAASTQSNYMTNIMPQTATSNRGAWLRTEEIVECYRDQETLLVMGGIIWGSDKSNDYFVASHSVETPDYFWKVIIGKDKVIAWIVHNDDQATKKNVDRYLVSVREIEKKTGQFVPVKNELKDSVPRQSWPLPRGCNKG